MNKLVILILLIPLLYCLKAPAQSITLQDRIIAEHIYNFGIYVNWKKSSSLEDFDTEKFRIGILSSDTSMYFLMSRLCKWRMLKWKKIEVVHYTNIKDIRYIQILYVGRDMREMVSDVDREIKNWPTLLITDSCHNYPSIMINFFPRNALKRVEINKQNIESRGMKVSPLLFTIAKKYEDDWELMFKESEEQLELEKELVLMQQKTLEEKAREIKMKEIQISGLSQDIAEKEKHLNEQKDLLMKSQAELRDKMLLIIEKTRILNSQSGLIKGQEAEILERKKELLQQMKEMEMQKDILDNQKKEIDEQQDMIASQKKTLTATLDNLKKQQLIMYFLGIVLILIALLAINIYRGLRMKKKINAALKKKNVEIFHQKEEIESQRDEIEAQRDTVITQKKQIEYILSELTDSIHYAGRIQNAILPTHAKWASFPFPYFVMYHPRDIISGDFYWFEKTGDHLIVCVSDCTGHGVPGAFMSMLGVAALNDAVKEQNDFNPGKILDRTRDYIIHALQQSSSHQPPGSVKDGMDVALCSVNLKTLELQFAGANNPIYIVNPAIGHWPLAVGHCGAEANSQQPMANSQLIELKGDKMPIGVHVRMDSFQTQSVQLKKGDAVYLFSDGMADQFGGPRNKKFKYKQIKELLIDSYGKGIDEQKEIFETAFISWKGKGEQMDDVTLMGFII
jgi:serine phosphatase RsbU (regulator of sigma subunit)